MGSGEVPARKACSASRAQKWSMRRDHNLGSNQYCSPEKRITHSRSVAPLSRRPRTNSIIGSYKVLLRDDCIVAIRNTPDQFVVHVRPPVLAPVMSAQWIGERAGRGGEERRGKGTRAALRKQGKSSIEVKRELRRCRGRVRVERAVSNVGCALLGRCGALRAASCIDGRKAILSDDEGARAGPEGKQDATVDAPPAEGSRGHERRRTSLRPMSEVPVPFTGLWVLAEDWT
jgi:hypothetical protein